MLSLEYRWNKLKCLIRVRVSECCNFLFNPVVRKQLDDYKSIPIIIISFNRLHYLKRLVEVLFQKGYKNIVILDNASSFPPLLDYLNDIADKVTVHRLKNNEGHLTYWKNRKIYRMYSQGYYVVTDPDVIPVENCPDDFLKTFIELLHLAYDRTKVGFSLKIDDLKDENPNKERILKWESRFWKSKMHPKAYKAEIDTTFALYRPGYDYKLKHFTKAWRTDFPLQAQHGGWYLSDALSLEQEFYSKTANQSASWITNSKGELTNKVHKSLYE
ncbi:glycosyltransferase family 2 protein [Mangrovimonas aestuarii]|uniref:glycosyltransferase family 2 protein n=1 Tax=Mangrovimonas aestuarii TaxID=3018443 RepID=UPI0023784E20|nr:glycosyltransferase family 2 protein [Mangrovimonas aestuarii]